MEKNTSHILDIHTHKSEEASRGRAIINYQLPVGGALCLSSFYSAGIHPWQLTERDAEEQPNRRTTGTMRPLPATDS